jgi:hypothetical protein
MTKGDVKTVPNVCPQLEVKMSSHSESRNYYKKGSSKKQPEDRLFDKKQKEQCWLQAPKVPGIPAYKNIMLSLHWPHGYKKDAIPSDGE